MKLLDVVCTSSCSISCFIWRTFFNSNHRRFPLVISTVRMASYFVIRFFLRAFRASKKPIHILLCPKSDWKNMTTIVIATQESVISDKTGQLRDEYQYCRRYLGTDVAYRSQCSTYFFCSCSFSSCFFFRYYSFAYVRNSGANNYRGIIFP